MSESPRAPINPDDAVYSAERDDLLIPRQPPRRR